ncbi:glycoside hydrolase family 38 N-terminal domain-containing protein [Hyunsoonleella ulvae]|uniref:glycoside hydrolase family 38 N-terminal domain-containing protein n=1 Tax=Hyunsoonleella ulvae TaxID=2799948 RepID=UPI001939B341|nr:glycoside hydrolase family 38 C-terminal domain-containing protein [Hyunsoonleella ulvae]
MKLLKFLCTITLLAGISLDISAQSKYINGYGKAVSGVNFAYPSPHSYNDPCYLTRATKDVGPMEWETVAIPENHTGKTVSFIWVYGMDVTPNSEAFDLSVNNQKVLTFNNPVSTEEKSRTIQGNNGVSLQFIQSMVDSNRDEMGYAVLTLPTTMVTLGQPVLLKIGGVPNNSSAWYMTFKISPKNAFNAYQLKAVKKENDKLFSVVRFSQVHLGKPLNAKLIVEGKSKKVKLKTGLNEIDFLVPKVESPKTVEAQIQYGKLTEKISVALQPIKEWTVYLVQHSHTDIGYTRQQSEILAEHLRYIDDALDYCDQTDHYPKEAQFRWTCEVAWTVREYINSRPKAQVDRLIQRVKEGRIEVTGMFLNYSETIDETALAIQLQALKKFKAKGIDVTTAMQNDVNGIGWCMPDMYEDTGVKYLTMGVHAHRARLPFNKPTSFWWESPSGKRLLAYRSEHYMHGNALSLVSGEMDVFGSNLSKYLDKLEDKTYPFDRVAFQFSGYTTDNSPPSTKACDIIKKWNETYEWPKLKSALASEFMVHIEKNHPDDIETKKVSWPDWWTDGFGSAMKETKVLRNSYSQMLATMGLLSMVQTSGGDIPEQIHDEIRNCYDNLLLYSEHTFGASESIRDPYSKNTMDQWSQKSSYIWSANQQANLLREKAIGLIQPHVKVPKAPSVTVFNTLNWSRSGIAEVFIDYDILPLNKKTSIVDSNGNEIPSQIIRQRAEGTYWALWVKDVPPMGYATYTIKVLDEKAPPRTKKLPATKQFENAFYNIQINEAEKGITSIYDKTLNKELIDTQSPHALGTIIYERIRNRRDLERLTGTRRDTVFKPLNEKHYKFSSFKIEKVTDGAIWKSVICKAQLPECAEEASGITIEIRLHHHKKEIEFLYNMKKLDIIEPEGVYVAFPFSNDKAQLVFEAQGGAVRPGIDQLAGSASDWNTIQNYASVKSDDSQIVFCSEDTPLVQFGGINTGRYYYKNPIKNKGHIYSWVLNNYWVTNFRASQFGELNWKYQITSSENKSNTFATKFGWGNRVPFVSKANSGKEKSKNNQVSESLIDLNMVDNLLLVHARPTEANDGVILHLRETEGDHAILDINKFLENPGISEVYLVNSLGEKIEKLTAPFLVEHFETRFILLKTK